jgi:hypothetical protein
VKVIERLCAVLLILFALLLSSAFVGFCVGMSWQWFRIGAGW